MGWLTRRRRPGGPRLFRPEGNGAAPLRVASPDPDWETFYRGSRARTACGGWARQTRPPWRTRAGPKRT